MHRDAINNGVASTRTTGASCGSLATYDEILEWDSPECLGEFHAIVESAPLRSIVIRIWPAAAEQLLLVTNNRNRPLSSHYSLAIANQMESGAFDITGDTIKWSKTGALLDGQHRLDACVKHKKPFTTHAVFGLEDSIFDILDQGKKRSPAEVLALIRIEDYTILAAAVRWVIAFERRTTPQYLSQQSKDKKGDGATMHTVRSGHGMTPRVTRELVLGRLKDLKSYTKHGRLINAAFKHPPSLITAIAYCISRHDKGVAENFIHEWVHGARRERNENFDVLSKRIVSVTNQSGGRINAYVRAAMIVQTFNHWHAGEVASLRSLTWRSGWQFPAFEFDGRQFADKRRQEERNDTSLTATQARVYDAMKEAADDDMRVQISFGSLGEASNVPMGSISYVLSTLAESGLVKRVKEAEGGEPAIYRLTKEPA